MIAFSADSRRDLKGKEAAASMARPAGAGKKKVEAGASEPRVPLACLFPMESTAEARPVGAGKKRSASTAGKKMEETTALKQMEGAKPVDSLWKEGEMLKLRQELWEAEDLYSEIRQKVLQGTVERKMPAVDKKKKKKLVRVICSDAYIDDIIKDPRMMPELSAKQIKKCPKKDRQSYAMLKVINAKKRAYHHALIEQRRAFGFAYDELEVTDDDEKEVTDDQEVAVVKN